MTRRATIAALRTDLDAARRDMWLLAAEADWLKDECRRRRAIVDRQDETILALWQMIEQHERFIDGCDYHVKGGVTVDYQGVRP